MELAPGHELPADPMDLFGLPLPEVKSEPAFNALVTPGAHFIPASEAARRASAQATLGYGETSGSRTLSQSGKVDPISALRYTILRSVDVLRWALCEDLPKLLLAIGFDDPGRCNQCSRKGKVFGQDEVKKTPCKLVPPSTGDSVHKSAPAASVGLAQLSHANKILSGMVRMHVIVHHALEYLESHRFSMKSRRSTTTPLPSSSASPFNRQRAQPEMSRPAGPSGMASQILAARQAKEAKLICPPAGTLDMDSDWDEFSKLLSEADRKLDELPVVNVDDEAFLAGLVADFEAASTSHTTALPQDTPPSVQSPGSAQSSNSNSVFSVQNPSLGTVSITPLEQLEDDCESAIVKMVTNFAREKGFPNAAALIGLPAIREMSKTMPRTELDLLSVKGVTREVVGLLTDRLLDITRSFSERRDSLLLEQISKRPTRTAEFIDLVDLVSSDEDITEVSPVPASPRTKEVVSVKTTPESDRKRRRDAATNIQEPELLPAKKSAIRDSTTPEPLQPTRRSTHNCTFSSSYDDDEPMASGSSRKPTRDVRPAASAVQTNRRTRSSTFRTEEDEDDGPDNPKWSKKRRESGKRGTGSDDFSSDDEVAGSERSARPARKTARDVRLAASAVQTNRRTRSSTFRTEEDEDDGPDNPKWSKKRRESGKRGTGSDDFSSDDEVAGSARPARKTARDGRTPESFDATRRSTRHANSRGGVDGNEPKSGSGQKRYPTRSSQHS